MYRLLFFICFLSLLGCDPKPPVVDDPDITISVQDVTKFELNENNQFVFQVILSETSEQEITVEYETEEDTAENDDDFIATNGQLNFSAGTKSLSIGVEVIGDEWKESDEQFFVRLSNATNAMIAKPKGVGTIRNEDDKVNIPEDGYITPESYGGYTLNWQEEFDGTMLNTADWTHEIGNSGWGNNESQYYTDSKNNSYLSNGNLVIEAIKEQFQGADYTSARIITQNKKLFTHGRVDVRAILPEGQGIWPAIWMLGTNIGDVGWPACGEIDIMELVGHEPGEVHGTAHWGNQGQGFSHYKGNGYSLSNGEKFSEKYHVFSIIWEPNKITWYVDDNQFFTLSNSDVNGDYPFDLPFFFIFNIAVGGNWPGYPDATTQFPQVMVVDYIRVFDKN
jgi:beta-glucanase (GH16 family)